MRYNYFDYTQRYNFSKELNERKNFSSDGEVIGEVELDNNFYAELVKNGGIPGASDRIIVWLCHREHKERIYAFTILQGIMLCGNDTALQNIVRMKFATNYAKLKETYNRKYCGTERKMTNKGSVLD